MRGTKAKALRRFIYKDMSPKTREYGMIGQTWFNAGMRAAYQRFKRVVRLANTPSAVSNKDMNKILGRFRRFLLFSKTP